MFEIDEKYSIKSRIPIIVENYKVFIEYDEDILFTGKNEYGNWIIGSIIEDDGEKKKLFYFHIIVTNKTYLNFIKQKISYREIFTTNEDIYLIEKDYSRKINKIFYLKIESIPNEYLPLDNSFCPEVESKYSLEYIIRLRGQLADLNKALVEDLTEIQLGFEKILMTAIKLLKEFDIKPVIYQEAITPKSIRLGYDISFDKELFTEDMDLGRYLSSFLEYTLLYLPSDVELLFGNSNKKSNEYELFEYEIKKIYEKAAIQYPVEMNNRIKNDFVKGINELEDISEQIGIGFDEIEILKKFNEIELPIGYINKENKAEISKAVDAIEKYTDMILKDTEPKYYDVFIYHLNTETRNGNAIIISDKNEEKIRSRPKIRILGEQPLLKTKYTASLHEQKQIKILGKATKIGEQFKYIEIEYEEK